MALRSTKVPEFPEVTCEGVGRRVFQPQQTTNLASEVAVENVDAATSLESPAFPCYPLTA